MEHAPLSSRVAIGIAQRLPLKVCYWVLVRLGMRYTNGPTRPTEVIPDVTFLTVLERCNAELEGKGAIHRKQGNPGMESWHS